MSTPIVCVIDLGTYNRDDKGRFVKTYTLSHEVEQSGKILRIQRTVPAPSVERIGSALMKLPNANNILVLDRDGNDITFDFICFQD